MIVYFGSAFILLGILTPFIGVEGTFFSCVVLASVCLVISEFLSGKLRTVPYLLAATLLIVIPHTSLDIVHISNITGIVVLLTVGAVIWLKTLVTSKGIGN